MKKNITTIRAVNMFLLVMLFVSKQTFSTEISANTYFNEAEKLNRSGKSGQAVQHYLKAIETDPTHFESLFFLGNTYLQQGKQNEAIEVYQEALNLRPDSVQTRFNCALALEANGETDRAIQELQHAVRIHPSYTKARVILANMLQRQGKDEQALAQYSDVIRIDPNSFDAHLSMASMYAGKHDFVKAVEHYKKAITIRPNHLHANFNLGYVYNQIGELHKAIDIYQNMLLFAPDCVDAQCNLAHTFRYLGRVHEAIELYEQVLQKWPNQASTHYGYAEALLKAGDLENGWREFEWRWKRETDTRGFSRNMWNGHEDLDGKTVLVRAEYGQGDTIQFIRFAKFLKELGATVVAEVQHTLVTLLSCCPYLDEVVAINDPLPEFDTQVPVMSLPHRCGIQSEQDIPHDVPYLELPAALVEYWQTELARDGNFKIGLCWEGSTYYDSIRGPLSKKAMHLEMFKAIAELPNVTLYSLQWGGASNQIDEVDFEVRSFGPDFDMSHGRFMDTAAVIKNMDMVISIDTSVAHLAGALGAPVWVLLPTVADWRWMLDRDDTPWYPNVKLFRQENHGDWESVLANVKRSLSRYIQQRKKKSDIVSAEISIGELIDKITILHLKNKYISDEKKLKNVRKELQVLSETRDTKVPQCKELDQLTRQLLSVNQQLWNIEDAIRDKERNKEFDDDFIQLARSVYITNDGRCALKRKINLILGSNLVEEKSYAAY
ncbi:DUF6165 family protein [Candidatus Dependentiae bacterium]